MPYDLQLGIAGAIDSGLGRVLGGNAVEQLQNLRQAQAQQEEYQAGKARAENMRNVLSRVRDPEQLKAAAWDMMQSGDEAGAMQLLEAYKNLTARPTASSTIGKIQADIDAGLIDPETGAAALKKATTIPPVYDPVSGNMIYAGGGGFTQPSGGSALSIEIPPEFAGNPRAQQAYLEKQAALAAERGGEKAKKETGANNMLDLIDEARSLLPLATSGKLETKIKEIGQDVFGYSTDASQADAQLKVIGANLTSNIPRMEGPQSDKDTQMYREAASDVANTLIPAGDRMAALKTLERIQRKYAGKGFVSEKPSTPKYQEGQTATGRNGEKLVYTGGKWRAQ